MIIAILGLLLIALGLVALALQRFYSAVPAKELKRLAARGDELAVALYRPVAYGASVRLLLWGAFCPGMAGGFLLVMYALPIPVAFFVVALSVSSMVVIYSLRLSVRSAHFAVQVAPAVQWIMGYLHGPLSFVAGHVNRFRIHSVHSGLYEKEDLLDLLEQQRNQPDNRIPDQQLDMIARVAEFDDRQAADILEPMSRLKLIDSNESIGPVLLGELHQSGQSEFLVYQENPGTIVGALSLRSAVAAKHGGKVADIMNSGLSFVHEDFSLRQVLKAFIVTRQFVVVVINNFEEPVGVITLDQLLSQLMGQSDQEEFGSYDNSSLVATFKPKQLQPVTEGVVAGDGSGQASSTEETEVLESRP